jgi:hypothetical protein
LYGIVKQIFENQIMINHDTREECLNGCQRANDQIEQGLTYLRADTLDMNARAQVSHIEYNPYKM